MDRLTNENMFQALIPPTWEQLQKEMPDTINALVTSMLGLSPPNHDEFPVWYVLTKASGVTGIPIQVLYDDPQTRQHAMAVMAAELTARQRVAEYTEWQANDHAAKKARAVEAGFARQQAPAPGTPPQATGGPVQPGAPYIVGEPGPEVYAMPAQGSQPDGSAVLDAGTPPDKQPVNTCAPLTP